MSQADQLAAAAAQLRALAMDLRERGDLAAYHRAVRVLALVLGAGGADATGMAITSQISHASHMSTSDYAAAAGLTANAVRRACREGRITARKVGRAWLVDVA